MLSLDKIVLRTPSLEDGSNVYQLINRCPPLDTNSNYCNLLQCGHFFETSIAAEAEGQLVGFVSGYKIPARPDTLFIWQVAVSEEARGLGLASQMVRGILTRHATQKFHYLETTITEDNHASWALFKGLAAKLSTDITSSAWLDCETHFDGLHKSEALVRLGPFTNL